VLWVDGGKIRECGPTAKVTSAYEALFNPRNTDERRPETSNAKARFLRWEIIEPRAKDRNELSSFGAVTVRFVLEVNKTLRAAHHGIALYDSESRLMWGTEANALHLEPGIRQFAYTFPSLPLRPGFYSWQVSLYDDGHELVDVWDCLPGLLVATQPVTHSKDEWAGILNIPSRFESSCLEEKVT
jgi:Wzt C-terminal domain